MEQNEGVEDGFTLRLEARLRNAKLVKAREEVKMRFGLTEKDVARGMGICFTSLYRYERMQCYPSPATQKKICDYYRKMGVFLLEEDIFPEELKVFKPQPRYRAERVVKKEVLLTLSEVDRRLLPPAEYNIGDILRDRELRERVDAVLGTLTQREREIICMRYGIGTPEMTLEEVGERLNISRERARQIEYQALKKLQHPLNYEKLEDFFDREGWRRIDRPLS